MILNIFIALFVGLLVMFVIQGNAQMHYDLKMGNPTHFTHWIIPAVITC